ncbi:immunoglobulin kappa light chain-like isoform X1 [Anguilla rostrata]|uniref:immunoglobulin kappa light chain-like isoform X1 n=1 Tax=Anguilla rostrata TaxID=7938 RepID=UPI0030CB5181
MFLGSGIILFSVVIVADALSLVQKTISVTATVGDTAVLTCEATGLSSSDYVHWYQKKEGEPFKRVLYIDFGGRKVHDSTHAQKNSFSVEKSNPPYDLRIDSVEMAHAATYYCASWQQWDDDFKIFGTGTKLIVTEETKPLKAPTVIAYPPSKPQNGKTTLLCVAMDMFPDIARFKWKEGDNDVASANQKVLEQKMESGTASMLIIDEINAESKHTCTVEHEGTTKTIQKEIPAGPIIEVDPGANSRVETEVTVCNGTQPKQIDLHRISDESFGLSRSLYLASLTYTLMILKSVGYFGVACLIMFKRSTNRPVKRI